MQNNCIIFNSSYPQFNILNNPTYFNNISPYYPTFSSDVISLLNYTSIPLFTTYLYYKIINKKYSFITKTPNYQSKINKIKKFRKYYPQILNYILLLNPNLIFDTNLNIHPSHIKQMCIQLLLNPKTYLIAPNTLKIFYNNKYNIYKLNNKTNKYSL